MTRERNWYKEEMFVRFNVLGKRVIDGKFAHQLEPQTVTEIIPV